MQAFWQQLLGQDPPPVAVRHLVGNSAQVQPGDLFVALPGIARHGNEFAAQAVANGAVMIVTDRPLLASVPVIVVADLSAQLPKLLPLFYPLAEQAPVVAITGTNGKTSISQYLAQLLTAMGKRAMVLGTTGNGVWPNLLPASHTTPDTLSLYRLLHQQQADGGVDYVIMEASSHALQQGRLGALPIRLALFSNLTQDHLDYHHNMADYFAAKSLLFTRPERPPAVINIDDPYGQQLAAQLTQQVRTVSAQSNDRADLWLQRPRFSEQGLQATLMSPEPLALQSPLLAPFNAENVLLALAAMQGLGWSLAQCLPAVRSLQPALGRMQTLRHPGQPVVVIDYAHTPDALTQVLSAARYHCSGRLWVVFGCGGDRDVSKRPLMARQAEILADELLLTDDNPRSEASSAIISDMLAGLRAPERAQVIADRARAIATALSGAQANDLVLIAGKGHEDYQEIQGVRYPFSDWAQVQAYWQEVGA